MIHIRIALGAAVLAAMGACTSPDRLGGGDTVDLNNQAGLGAEIGPVETGTAEYFSNSVGDRVLFAVDQSTLSPEAQGVLAAQAAWLIDNRDFNAKIEGHADEQGTRVYNFNLGEKRANAVREYLISQGVAPGRLSTISYGKERPIEICSEEACYAKNRRAVTVIAAGLTS
ncbi:MAG: peptidoglycan-associated lipoprotein Pal [Rhodobacter sp.]|nr:peptidoglycan-associated lipoprotein Pal [Rhodobacter sp.]